MLPERLNDTFGELVAERLDQVMPDDPDAAVAWLEEVLGDTDRTDDLLNGRGIDLDEDERAQVSDVLMLEPVLLGALFTPTSPEVLIHMLGEIVPRADAAPGEEPCAQCASLAARVAHATVTTPIDDLEDLVFDALSHLVCEPAPQSDEQLGGLIEVFAGLSPAGRLRVLAMAYEEEERERRGVPASAVSELQRARAEDLTEPARNLVDLLALAPTGSVSATDLVTSLSLPGVTALAPIEQNLELCGRILASHGVADTLIIKVHRSGQAHYSLHPILLAPMRALIRAEHRSGPAA